MGLARAVRMNAWMAWPLDDIARLVYGLDGTPSFRLRTSLTAGLFSMAAMQRLLPVACGQRTHGCAI